MIIERTRRVPKIFTNVLLIGLAGCAAPAESDENVELHQAALTVLPGESSRNTPTHFMQEGADMLATTIGNGSNAALVVTYTHTGGDTLEERGQYALDSLGTAKASYRPFRFWANPPAGQEFTVLMSDLNRSDTVRDTALESPSNPSASLVNPQFSFLPVIGPTVGLGEMAPDNAFCAFTLYDSGSGGRGRIILQSCLQSSSGVTSWDDWGLELPPIQGTGSTWTPNLSPIAFFRSAPGAGISDSLSYPCYVNGTQICEYRLGGAGNGKTFTTTFGSGSFLPGTRPTAFSNGYSYPQTDNRNFFTLANPERWMFAAKVDGNTRSIVARRETSALDSGTQPTYLNSAGTDLTLTVESSTAGVAYSTPMSYVRSDLKTGLVYYRTAPGQTTRVMESVCSASGSGNPKMDSTCSAPVAIYDVGMVIPSGNEPLAYVEATPNHVADDPGQNTVIIRLPFAGGVSDIGELQKGKAASDGYTKVMLPLPVAGSGFNLVQKPSAFDDAAWTKINVANPMAAANINTHDSLGPNTTYTSELLRETTATGNHGVSQGAVAPDRTSLYRWTAYLRAETRTGAQLVMTSTDDAASAVTVSVDLTAGTVTGHATTGSATYVSSSIESMGISFGEGVTPPPSPPKWYRVSVVGKPTTVVGTRNITGKILMTSGGSNSYAGSATKGLFVWGAELMRYDQSAPAAPTGLVATPNNTMVLLSWPLTAGAATYNVYRGTTAGGESPTAIATGINAATYTDTGRTNGTKYYYKIAAVNSVGTSSQSSEASATPSAASTKVNCGDNGAFPPFVPDTFFSGGAGKTRDAIIDVDGVVGPAPAAIYNSQHYASPFSYTITGFTASSSHLIRLHFAETNPANNAPNKRKFSVAINGTTQISNLDLFATVGAINKAYIKQFTLPADSTGKYVLSFTASLDSATISGIEVQ
jgi:hypothetical protein